MGYIDRVLEPTQAIVQLLGEKAFLISFRLVGRTLTRMLTLYLISRDSDAFSLKGIALIHPWTHYRGRQSQPAWYTDV